MQYLEISSDTAPIPFGESTPQGKRPLQPPTPSAPLAETILRLLENAPQGHGLLLNYPLDRFLVPMLAARDIDNENCERESVRRVIWLRFAIHLNEAHYSLKHSDGREKANGRLTQILRTQNPEANPGEDTRNC